MGTTTRPDVPVTVEERSQVDASSGVYESYMDGLRGSCTA